MPLGSSSEAPVIRPGPSASRSLGRRGSLTAGPGAAAAVAGGPSLIRRSRDVLPIRNGSARPRNLGDYGPGFQTGACDRVGGSAAAFLAVGPLGVRPVGAWAASQDRLAALPAAAVTPADFPASGQG